MKRNFESLSIDELWAFREGIAKALAAKIIAQKSVLEDRLDELGRNLAPPSKEKRQRRPYPKVYPKFHNPEQPSQTWAGRGKQPRWLAAELKSGKRLADFRIESVAA
jgi:DNA-binding protein H-NS